MKAKSKTFALTETDFQLLKNLQDTFGIRSCSAILSMALRALGKSFGAINSNILESDQPRSIPSVNLPGMNERIVKTQMERWQLSAEEYMAIVQKLINDFAASGGQMKNPENLIWKACSRYVHERDIQKRANAAAQTTPSADGSGESIYELQDRLG